MSGWRVEPGTGGLIHLYHEADQAVLYHDDLDPGEAWDLGDDLIIVATQLLPWEPVGFTTAPPWMDEISVMIAALPTGTSRLALVCADHGVVEYEGIQISVGQLAEGAKAHWFQQHREVNHAQRPDGRPDETVRGSDEAAPAAPDVHDPAA